MASTQFPLPTQTKGLLVPKSPIDPLYGRIKKVFIAYVHSPNEYEVYIPPYSPEQLYSSPNLLQQVLQNKLEHERQQRMRISEHTNCVLRLANYLTSMGVAVAYEEYWRGSHMTNQLQLFEDQINDSDYVLLVITPSMNHYLQRVAPIDEEILFTSNFLYNLMTIKKPQGTEFVPVFLNSQKDTHLLPTCLASSTSYSLIEPFNCQSLGDFNDLYRMITNQRTEHPSTRTVLTVPTRKTAFSFLSGQGPSTPAHTELYTRLSRQHDLIPDNRFIELSYQLASQWRRIAQGLGLTEREILECQVKGADPKEACYQMLWAWKGKDPNNATVARLANGLRSADCGGLLKYLVFQ